MIDLGFSDIFEDEFTDDEPTTVPLFVVDDSGDDETTKAQLDALIQKSRGLGRREKPEEDYSDGGIMQEQYGEEFEI